MFIPLHDENPTSRVPYVTLSLIAINVLVFCLGAFSPQGVQMGALRFGSIPYEISHFRSLDQALRVPPLLSLLTSLFVHGSLFHLLGNMLYLWIFGDNVEDRVGHIPYLFFYLLVGVAGSIVYCLASPASRVPIIGASGAIAGILGAYFVLYPKAKVLTLLPLFFFITLVEIPAVWFLLLWFGMQVLNGFTTSLAADSVAWWAHIGGFVAGAALINLFAASERFKV